MSDLALVRTLEERMFNAWPALQTVYLDGWHLRMAGGHTKRANAASQLDPSSVAAAELIAAVQRLYGRAGIEPMVRLTPLSNPGTDEALEAAGWSYFDPSLVMAAPLPDPPALSPGIAVLLEPEPSEAWVAGAAEAYEFAPWQQDMLARIAANIRVDAAFATVSKDGRPAGYGIAVAERGYVGLYDLAVMPAARGSGAGTGLVAALLAWGHGQGARTAYLQVRETNERAQALYRRFGFTPIYRYWCRRLTAA